MEKENLQKIILLIRQGRYDTAEEILGPMLAMNPNEASYLYYMSVIAGQSESRYAEAQQLIERAIAADPTAADFFIQKAQIHLYQHQYDACEYNLEHAIKLDPSEAHAIALLAHVRLVRKKYDDALLLANQALELDPSHTLAINVRSTALLKLNDTEASQQTIADALHQDPNNAYTHANYGWGLLESGKPHEALIHFKEALKLSPNMDFAKEGMKEAMKARYYVYRKFLQYSFWLGNKSEKMQWFIILAFFFSGRILNFVSEKIPILEPIIYPILIVLAIVALSTWLMKPIANLFLRIHPLARYALSKHELQSSNLVIGFLAIFFIALITYFINRSEFYLALTFYALLMLIPCGTLGITLAKRSWVITYTVILGLIGLLALYQIYVRDSLEAPMTMIFVYAFIGFQFFYNFIAIKEDNV